MYATAIRYFSFSNTAIASYTMKNIFQMIILVLEGALLQVQKAHDGSELQFHACAQIKAIYRSRCILEQTVQSGTHFERSAQQATKLKPYIGQYTHTHGFIVLVHGNVAC